MQAEGNSLGSHLVRDLRRGVRPLQETGPVLVQEL